MGDLAKPLDEGACEGSEIALAEHTASPANTPVVSFLKSADDGKFVLADRKQLTDAFKQILRAETFSGPMPHPKHLQLYEATLPGAAKSIFDEFKANSEHQRRMEERSIALQERLVELQGRDNATGNAQERRSQHYAAGLVVFGILAAVFLAYLGQPWVASALVGTLLVAVIAGFLNNVVEVQKNRSSPESES